MTMWRSKLRNQQMRRTTRRKSQPMIEGLESRQLLSNYYVANAASGKVLDDPSGSTASGTLIQQYQLNGGANQQWQFYYLSDGNYEIMNATSGKVLDDPGGSTANGTHIQQYQWNGGSNQQWHLLYLSNGNYAIENAGSLKWLEDPGGSLANGTLMVQDQYTGAASQQWTLLGAGTSATVGPAYFANQTSGLVLDDPSSSTASRTLIQQNQLNGGANQQWVFVPFSSGYGAIVNTASGLVLDDPGGSTSNNTLIQQYQLNGGANQQWKLLPQSNGTYVIQNWASGLVLDDPGGSTANHTIIQQYQANGGPNQQWTLLGVSSSVPVSLDNVTNAASGKVLDDPGGSTANHTLIQQYQFNGGSNQQWAFVPLSDGFDIIVNTTSGKVLDDPGGSTSNNTLIQQYQLTGGANQQWLLLPQSNGTVVIENATSGKVLDDPSGSQASGTLIQQYQANGGINQDWVLSVPSSNTLSFTNWSGYAAETSLSTPQANSVSAVSGSWVVPSVTGPSSGSTFSSVWVGIDGFSNNTVEQVGTEEDVINGRTVYDAWWEMFSTGLQQPEQVITSMTVQPGDSIAASVQFISSGTHAGQFELSITDASRSNDSFTTFQSSAATQSPLAQRNSAEWIVEAPTIVGSGVASLANFGGVVFTNASATINGVTGPINASSWQSQAMNIVTNGVTNDTTSTLTSSGKSFAVYFDSSPSAGARSSGTTEVHSQAVPAVGTTLESGLQAGTLVIGSPAWAGASGRKRFHTPIGQHARSAQGFSIHLPSKQPAADGGDTGVHSSGTKRLLPAVD
jgi:hypothetical protein